MIRISPCRWFRLFPMLFSCYAMAVQYEPVLVDGNEILPTNSNFLSANNIPNKTETQNEIRNIAFVVDSYQIVIDTTPTVNPGNAWTTRTISLLNVTYDKTTLAGSTTQNPTTTGNPITTTYTANYDRTRLNSGTGTANLKTLSYQVPLLTSWTDAEFKVLDANDNLIYWVSTQRGAQMNYPYETHSATDLNAKIYYTCAEYYEGRKWILFVYNATNSRTIYEHARMYSGVSTPTIGGIVIQPNMAGYTVGGRSIASIFGKTGSTTNANYSYVYLKCSPINFEMSTEDYTGTPIWRPIIPQPIQKAY